VSTWILYLLLLRATLTSFSGMTSFPIVRDDLVVRRGVITDQQLNAALVIGQASPGPVGAYLITVGYLGGGVPGAIAGVLALATPALLAIPMLGILRLGRADVVSGASTGIIVAASVLTLIAGAGLAPAALGSREQIAIALGVLVLLAGDWVAPLWIVVLAGVAAALL
jgi:chromate transporter